ncbi:hypothetical protein [Thioflexithrix psekupsensis]|nr:hypothetical protein [Thioflexithrix psekupsensis]
MIFELVVFFSGLLLVATVLHFVRSERQCRLKYYARRLGHRRRSFHYPESQSIQLPVFVEDEGKLTLAASRSSDEKNYLVDLHHLTCTCSDWQQRRANYPAADIRRICKHLYEKLYHQGLEADLPVTLRLALQNGRKETCFQRIENEHGDFLIGFTPHSFWVKVFACIQNEPIIAIYRLDLDGWAYGKQPSHSCLLQAQIDALFFSPAKTAPAPQPPATEPVTHLTHPT